MLSVIVITYNEENNIRQCLRSLKKADEIIVIDSGSTDRTVEIAREFTDRIIITGNIPYGIKRNTGIEQAKYDWILWVDADEIVSDDLMNEIINTIKNPAMDAYYINRKSFFIDKFISHCDWYPDYTLRLFRKSAGIRFTDNLVHEKPVYKGAAGKLKNEILHYTDLTYEHYIHKMNNYTTLSASELHNKNRKCSISDIIFRPAFTFIKMYFFKSGYLDGFTGLVLCLLSGAHVMTKYLKLYYMKINGQRK